MEKKKNLRKEKIVEDLTWRDKKMRWRLGDITRVEERRRNRVWVVLPSNSEI